MAQAQEVNLIQEDDIAEFVIDVSHKTNPSGVELGIVLLMKFTRYVEGVRAKSRMVVDLEKEISRTIKRASSLGSRELEQVNNLMAIYKSVFSAYGLSKAFSQQLYRGVYLFLYSISDIMAGEYTLSRSYNFPLVLRQKDVDHICAQTKAPVSTQGINQETARKYYEAKYDETGDETFLLKSECAHNGGVIIMSEQEENEDDPRSNLLKMIYLDQETVVNNVSTVKDLEKDNATITDIIIAQRKFITQSMAFFYARNELTDVIAEALGFEFLKSAKVDMDDYTEAYASIFNGLNDLMQVVRGNDKALADKLSVLGGIYVLPDIEEYKVSEDLRNKDIKILREASALEFDERASELLLTFNENKVFQYTVDIIKKLHFKD